MTRQLQTRVRALEAGQIDNTVRLIPVQFADPENPAASPCFAVFNGVKHRSSPGESERAFTERLGDIARAQARPGSVLPIFIDQADQRA